MAYKDGKNDPTILGASFASDLQAKPNSKHLKGCPLKHMALH